MPKLANRRHERFCQEYLCGPHAADTAAAYVAAGFKRHDSKAARLAQAPHVVARLAELRAVAAPAPERSPDGVSVGPAVTIDRLLFEMEEARRLAIKNGQSSAAIGAVIAKAKLAGLWVDKREPANKYADLTDEQLEQRIREIDALLTNGQK